MEHIYFDDKRSDKVCVFIDIFNTIFISHLHLYTNFQNTILIRKFKCIDNFLKLNAVIISEFYCLKH